jgi:hypothetical protein
MKIVNEVSKCTTLVLAYQNLLVREFDLEKIKNLSSGERKKILLRLDWIERHVRGLKLELKRIKERVETAK